MEKRLTTTILSLTLSALSLTAASPTQWILSNGDTLRTIQLCPNAVRVQVLPVGHKAEPFSFYTNAKSRLSKVNCQKSIVNFQLSTESLAFYDANGKKLLQETPNGRTLKKVADQGFTSWQVAQAFDVPADDYQFGTGQFQDGNLNVKGLTRRLTQVNTQIALPMIISNKGYGILWNNAGLTEFNPAAHCLTLAKEGEAGEKIVVDATGTTGNKREERQYQQFTATLTIPETAEYSLLLDVGQSMARQHYLEIDGKVLYEANNLWLPPTTAVKAMLTQGEHIVVVRGEKNDTPSLYYNKVSADRTIFSSPVAQTLDYTIFTGTADEIIASYRALTGEVPMLPRWAFGYVHCRERYVSQDDVLKNAAEFRKRNIPIDMIVQDWQWWGNTGWNSMEFDPKNYANPKAMTDSLHNMNIKLMLSVWAKIDHNSKLGKQMEAQKNYIPNTDWIDFFSKKAGNAYWEAYKKNILPTGIDAWWQDATEPENDDLANRLVDKGRLSGNAVRNVFPFAVNDVVYNGLLQERPNERPMIMTRSASPGIQRFGVLTWSGDVGNDYKTLERQITGGLGQMACGIPWWTYDAGGFFRPSDQYTNADYQQRMIRWIQNAVYLPVMRVHGYMSQTEPWRYTDSQQSTYSQFVKAIRKRYNLFSYIYSEAARVSREGSTLMRPLVFDFPNSEEAMMQTTAYMFGKNILVCPDETLNTKHKTQNQFTQESNSNLAIKNKCLLFDKAFTRLDDDFPAYIKDGSILPWNEVDENTRSTSDIANAEALTLRIFPGADADFTLYEDDGTTLAYQRGEYSEIRFLWNDAKLELTILPRIGSFKDMQKTRTFCLQYLDGRVKKLKYNGKKIKVKF